MDFEYDPEKNASNLERHGIDFVEAQDLWDVAHVVIPAGERIREQRHALVGKLEGRLYLVIFTMRGARIRLISCHRAAGRWEKIYASYVLKEKES
jgi:uncharacterized protein